MNMEVRQIINIARPSRTSTATSTPHCTPFTLPSNGLLTLGVGNVITLTSDAIFQPECTGSSDTILAGAGSPSWTDFRDPFYASTIPECYALAAATVIAYMLVIMLFITPRTFLREGAVVLGRRGFTNGPSASDAGIGIGGRPWLQKVAALTVAISLTIATADTFRVAEEQYEVGYMDAAALQSKVEDGLELKIIRVISDTFLWLAQAQTLIRLFPRQREKIIIKWTAFALISLDVLFSILNNFVYNGNSRPHSFVDAIPALAYLFQLALSLLYAAWVIYYSITKKQFAFYHVQMKNMCLVSLLSLVSVLIPVVFFVLDISQPSLAGWGDYVRWVGAAAASVVVWEWVERIEALERDDKKDGVLGREVFDGDEMFDANSTSNDHWKNRNSGKGDDGDHGGGGGAITSSNGRSWPSVAGLAHRYRPRARQDVENGKTRGDGTTRNKRGPRPRPPLWPTRPPAAATPISRTDSASAESTVYAIRYHPISEATPPVRENTRDSMRPTEMSRHNSAEVIRAPSLRRDSSDDLEKKSIVERMEEGYGTEPPPPQQTSTWDAIAKANPFRRRGREPPPQVSAQTAKTQEAANVHGPSSVWDVRARLEDFAATQAEKLRDKNRASNTVGPLPVTVIPAPPRRRDLAATLEELEDAERREQRPRTQQPAERPMPERSMSVATRITGPVVEEGERSRHPQPQRLSDPYRPDDLNGHSIHQRGAISFVTALPQDREANEAISPVSPIEVQRVTPLSFIGSARSSPVQPRSPASLRRPDGLPVTSIPAPPRRPRSPDEDD
ncbi:hypothetical protein IFR05_009534 [Cadophora sp. M221]|nr:hypothetical protein IFR05_009534 [Cadophora sp. M221]